jgi:hypothetical protein
MFTLLILSLARAWWEAGHMLVARIAQDVLQAENQSAYRAAMDLILALGNFTDGRSNTFVESAVWADDVKDTGFHAWDSFHFLDRVYDPDGMVVVMDTHDKDINSVNMVGWCKSVLQYHRGISCFERALMLRMLIHVVGDIHQPLHSVAMYNASLPKGDMGGNLVNIVTVNNEKMNLHAFFDSVAAIIQHPSDGRIPRPLDESGDKYFASLA